MCPPSARPPSLLRIFKIRRFGSTIVSPQRSKSTSNPTCPEKEWQGTSSSLKEEA